VITPSFIQIGEDVETIFNVAQITAVERKSVSITERNKASYARFTDRIKNGFVHSIFIYSVSTQANTEYIYATEEKRDIKFEEIRAALSPTVVAGDAQPNPSFIH